MIEVGFGLFVGAFLFGCAYFGFRAGLRLGLQAGKGHVPAALPLRGVLNLNDAPGKKDLEPPAELLEGWANMMGYTGEPEKAVRPE